MDRAVFGAILTALIVVGLLVLAYVLLAPFLPALLWAIVMVVVTYPAYVELVERLKGRRTLAAIAMTLAVAILVVGPFLLLTVYFAGDAIQFATEVQEGGLNARVQSFFEQPIAQRALGWIGDMTGKEMQPAVVAGRIQDWFRNTVGGEDGRKLLLPLSRAAGDALLFVGLLAANIFFILLAAFYFFRDGIRSVNALRDLLPLKPNDRDTMIGELRGAIVAAVRGGLVTALAQGLLGFVILFILGIARPVFWSVVMGLASLIPVVGTAIVWLPIAGLLALEGEIPKALVLTGYGVVVIGLSDNLLRPLLVGQHMEAHPLLLFFGILGGIMAFGFSGIVLGPVLIACLSVSTRLFRREFAEGISGTKPAS